MVVCTDVAEELPRKEGRITREGRCCDGFYQRLGMGGHSRERRWSRKERTRARRGEEVHREGGGGGREHKTGDVKRREDGKRCIGKDERQRCKKGERKRRRRGDGENR